MYYAALRALGLVDSLAKHMSPFSICQKESAFTEVPLYCNRHVILLTHYKCLQIENTAIFLIKLNCPFSECSFISLHIVAEVYNKV